MSSIVILILGIIFTIILWLIVSYIDGNTPDSLLTWVAYIILPLISGGIVLVAMGSGVLKSGYNIFK